MNQGPSLRSAQSGRSRRNRSVSTEAVCWWHYPGGVRECHRGRQLRYTSPGRPGRPKPRSPRLAGAYRDSHRRHSRKNGDLFGTAVNNATRLQGIAGAGGTVVSAAVRDDVAGKLPASFADLGMHSVKNIKEPLRVYSLSPAGTPVAAGVRRAANAPQLSDRPSTPFYRLTI